jgi:hypothetical protein
MNATYRKVRKKIKVIAAGFGLDADFDESVIYFRKGFRSYATMRLLQDRTSMEYVIKGGCETAGWAVVVGTNNKEYDRKSAFECSSVEGFEKMFQNLEQILEAELSPMEIMTSKLEKKKC